MFRRSLAMEKLTFYKLMTRLISRRRLYPQYIRTIQTSQVQRNDESDNDAQKKESLASLLGGMKIVKAPGKSRPSPMPERIKKTGQSIREADDDESITRKDKVSLKRMFLEAKQEINDKDELPEIVVEPALLNAAQSVAESLPGDARKTKSDLLKQLQRHEDATEAGQRGEKTQISDLMSGLKVEKQAPAKPDWESQKREFGIHEVMDLDSDDVMGRDHGNVRSHVQDNVDEETTKHPYRRQRRRTLFDRKRLNIFNPVLDKIEDQVDEKPISIWDVEAEKQLHALETSPIRNGFDEMIQWTKEGKLWRYPIDNEQGLEEEQNVGFHEHVFLDHELKTGFPKKGPVKHFMELVITGLSKNAYLTVQQKKDHIDWFRVYFKDKKAVLKEAGALLEEDNRNQIKN
ncbi:small ribosomal subunit protein mS31-like [Saccoglossus kowalevskii]|uniref:Small ribosomal subunit protein mS31 n=1 Tax=Saccoglossus kowalevskii TaxID=10224 RepID=A0ABM0MDW4_SACKO|nr:PREDICTED: 28S ribosomal protein S31, mitochondrial-like [Saccoglossus kowalevskii]